MGKFIAFGVLLLAVGNDAFGLKSPFIDSGKPVLNCPFVVVGGGFAGLTITKALADRGHGASVCLFEGSDDLGGRVMSTKLSDNDIHIPMGGIRLDDEHTEMHALATKFNITLEQVPYAGDIIITARGHTSNDKDVLRESAYPSVQMTEDEIYDIFMAPVNVASANQYPSMRDYVTSLVGAEAFSYIQDMSRFRADWESAPGAFLEFLVQDFTLSGDHYYTKGTLSAFIRELAIYATTHGVRIFKSEPVESLDYGTSQRYVISTTHHAVHAERVFLAVPPTGNEEWAGVTRMTGDVAVELQASDELQAVRPIPCAIGMNTWSTRWWEDPGFSGYTRRQTTESCVNHIELPMDDYLKSINATRSVYSDEPRCVSFWRAMAKRPVEEVTAYLIRALSDMYGQPVPDVATFTQIHVWENAWHLNQPGSDVSMSRMEGWARAPGPLNLALAGEAYHLDRTWAVGAVISAYNSVDSMLDETVTRRQARTNDLSSQEMYNNIYNSNNVRQQILQGHGRGRE